MFKFIQNVAFKRHRLRDWKSCDCVSLFVFLAGERFLSINQARNEWKEFFEPCKLQRLLELPCCECVRQSVSRTRFRTHQALLFFLSLCVVFSYIVQRHRRLLASVSAAAIASVSLGQYDYSKFIGANTDICARESFHIIYCYGYCIIYTNAE